MTWEKGESGTALSTGIFPACGQLSYDSGNPLDETEGIIWL
jgi:hypothetical protein